MIKRICRALALFTCVISTLACAERTAVVEETLSAPKVALVLDGTDLIDIDEIKRVALGLKNIEGHYQTEQGGSILYLSISHKQDHWVIDRVYTEPAMPKASKQYQAKQHKFGLANDNASLVIQRTTEGVLVYEMDSGSESIPNEYWVHYLRVSGNK